MPILTRAEPTEDTVIDTAGLTIDRFYRAQDIILQGSKLSLVSFPGDIDPVNGICGTAILITACLFPMRSDHESAVFVESYFAYFEDAEFSMH